MSNTLLADDRPTARKTHRCSDCEGLILPGTRYRSQRVASDGSVWTYKEHESCHDVYWRLHREAGLWEDEGVDPESVREVFGVLFTLMAQSWGRGQTGG